MTPFRDLEAPICDIARVAQILATIFEDVQPENVADQANVVLTAHEHEMIAFLIYDLCGRTKRLTKEFYVACEGREAA